MFLIPFNNHMLLICYKFKWILFSVWYTNLINFEKWKYSYWNECSYFCSIEKSTKDAFHTIKYFFTISIKYFLSKLQEPSKWWLFKTMSVLEFLKGNCIVAIFISDEWIFKCLLDLPHSNWNMIFEAYPRKKIPNWQYNHRWGVVSLFSFIR